MDIQILETPLPAAVPVVEPPYVIQYAALGRWSKAAARWTEREAKNAAWKESAKIKGRLFRIVRLEGDRQIVLSYLYANGKRIDAGRSTRPRFVTPKPLVAPSHPQPTAVPPAVVAPPVVASTRPRLNPWHPEPAPAMGTVEIDGRVFEIVWNGCR